MGTPMVLILLAQLVVHTGALQCLEGSECLRDASCTECSGVACTRIVSFNLNDNKAVAYTCIPYATRTHAPAYLEEGGCRQRGNRQVCVCYDRDYCNIGSRLSVISVFIFIITFFVL